MSDQWKCETCRYFRPVVSGHPTDIAHGLCKRYPKQWKTAGPQPWGYPDTTTEDWCGEWKPLNTPG